MSLYPRKLKKKWRKSKVIIFLCLIIITSLALIPPFMRQKIVLLYQRTSNFSINTLSNMGFQVKNIFINELKYTNQIDILNRVPAIYGRNIFQIDTDYIVTELKKIGWIDRVTVHKKLPDTIEIHIVEYNPYALWQHQGKISVVTVTGVVIPAAKAADFLDLPLVIGKGANEVAVNLISILDDYKFLKQYFRSYALINQRRWRIYCYNGIVIDLPENNMYDSVHKLDYLTSSKKILEKDVENIDFRSSNKIIIKMKNRLNLSQFRNHGEI